VDEVMVGSRKETTLVHEAGAGGIHSLQLSHASPPTIPRIRITSSNKTNGQSNRLIYTQDITVLH
jgi:hypothetical protein